MTKLKKETHQLICSKFDIEGEETMFPCDCKDKLKKEECVWCQSKYECSEHQKVTKKPAKEKIQEIKIDLFQKTDIQLLKEYNIAKANWIDEFGYDWAGFIFSYKRRNPAIGEASWNKYYPNGFEDWKIKQGDGYNILTGYGQQLLIDKLNQVIKVVNKIQK